MNVSLLKLLHLADTALPIGGFSHSAGLETYVQMGLVINKETANNFVVAMLSYNIRYTDAAFASLVYDAAAKNDLQKILLLDDECTAIKIPKEIRNASNKLGLRLLKNFEPFYKNSLIDAYAKAIRQQNALGHYAILFALYAHAFGVEKQAALSAFYYNAAVGFVTNAVKLVPLSQQTGQAILFGIHPLIADLVAQTLTPDNAMLGLCCVGFDIKSMQHEKLYSRLYMS